MISIPLPPHSSLHGLQSHFKGIYWLPPSNYYMTHFLDWITLDGSC